MNYVALVQWDDAEMAGGWDVSTEAHRSDLICYSIGFLLFEDKTRIVLVQSLTDGGIGNRLTIPALMVRKITRIPLGP